MMNKYSSIENGEPKKKSHEANDVNMGHEKNLKNNNFAFSCFERDRSKKG